MPKVKINNSQGLTQESGDSAQDFVLEKQASADRINAVNGSVTLGQKTVAFCTYSGQADPGWIVVIGDQATVPA